MHNPDFQLQRSNMVGFSGIFEERADNLQDFKEARLQRLQEVRQQEKLLSSDRCSAYRKVIELRTQTKTEFIKSMLISEKKNHQNRLILEWQGSLVDTGYGHRTALEVNSRNSVRISTADTRNHERLLIAANRGREAMIERNSEIERQQKVTAKLMERGSFRTTAIASDREDARAAAETKIAEHARKAMLMKQKTDKSSNVINMTRQNAVRIQDRGPVAKDINVIRHGKSEVDEVSSISCARVEERNALAKRWGVVMKEMRHRNIITSRALIARQTMRSINQGEAFENELSLLMLADKSLCRIGKARNVASVRAAADRVKATPNAARAFEREFLSTSVVCTSPSNYVDLATIHDRSVTSSDAFDHGEASSDIKLPVPARQPVKWEDDEEFLVTRSGHTIPASTRSSLSLYDTIQRNINPTIIGGNICRQSIQNTNPAIWGLLSEVEIGMDCASKLSTSYSDESRTSMPSRSAILARHHAPKDNACIPTRISQSKNKLTELLCLPASPFSEEDSVSNVGAVRAMETSTSTANTLRARHDHSQSTSFTHNQHDEHDGVLERPIASLVSSSSLGKERRYLSSSSSSVLSDSLASTNSLARQLSISRQTQSSSEEFSSGTQSRKLKNASATDEESVTLAMTVKLRKMSCSEGVDGKQEDEAASVESFEVYFEDDCGRTKDTSSPRLRSTISKLALNNSQPSTPIESLRSSVSDSDADDARESEADDNMSAITWPDPASQRVLDVTYAMYEQTAAVLPANAEPASDDTQQSDEKKSIFSDDDSLEGDSFLLELDALSLSWLQRKKALEEKKRALA